METTAGGWLIVDREAGVLSSEYAFNDKGRAHTFTAKLPSGGLLIVSPGKGLSDQAFEELAEFGEVKAVVAPNGFHHLGQGEWRARFPDARYFAAQGSIDRIKAQNPDVGEFEEIEQLTPLLGDTIGFRTACSSKCGENWFWVKTEKGFVWYASDLVCNWDTFPGALPLRLIWRLSGSGLGFKLFHLAMMAILKDKKAVLRDLKEDVEKYPPVVIIPGHGPLVDRPTAGQEFQALLAKAV